MTYPIKHYFSKQTILKTAINLPYDFWISFLAVQYMYMWFSMTPRHQFSQNHRFTSETKHQLSGRWCLPDNGPRLRIYRLGPPGCVSPSSHSCMMSHQDLHQTQYVPETQKNHKTATRRAYPSCCKVFCLTWTVICFCLCRKIKYSNFKRREQFWHGEKY